MSNNSISRSPIAATFLEVDGIPYEGATDDDGLLEASISPSARSAVLHMIDDQLDCKLQFGQLDPLEENLGIQQRLQNLGFFYGALDGEMSDELRNALFYFQSSVNLEPTGDMDDATRQKLFDMHDNPHPQREAETVSEENSDAPATEETIEPDDIDPEKDEAEMRRFTSLDK